MDDIVYMCAKNKYGYTIKQLRIDYKNKTYQNGNFKMMAATNTLKSINEKIQELDKLGFKEIIR